MKHFLTSLLLVFALWQHPAQAEPDITEPVISRLETEGYTVSGVKRTWLGRIVITARNRQNLREVVLNRTSGEVLRDSLFSLPETTNPVARTDPNDSTRATSHDSSPDEGGGDDTGEDGGDDGGDDGGGDDGGGNDGDDGGDDGGDGDGDGGGDGEGDSD